jgi:hypothetical protein
MRLRYLFPATIVALVALQGAALAELKQASGKVTLVRVHDVGTGYGAAPDFIDVEAVFWLDSQPGRAFGFQLRNVNPQGKDERQEVARKAMFDLLLESFRNDWKVTVEFNRPTPNDIVTDAKNGTVIRLWATRN